jgi:predicted porin
MQKKIIALAVAGLVSGAAFAQSNVTVYGKVDLGVVADGKAFAGSDTSKRLSSGVSGGSRIGFKGTEDLGGGLKASFVAETGFCADANAGTTGGGLNTATVTTNQAKNSNGFCSGAGSFMGRQATLAVSGGFGTVQAGRQYAPAFSTILAPMDPFGAGTAGQLENLMNAGVTNGNPRVNNSVAYVSPSMGGFTGIGAYVFGEQLGSQKKGQGFTFAGVYGNGPINAGLAYMKVNDANADWAIKLTTLGASYDLGVAKLSFVYQIDKLAATKDARDMMLGVTVPVGAGRVAASYVRHNEKMAANTDANQIGIGYFHPLSKRTEFYTAYARISNKNGAMFTVGNATEVGTGQNAFNLGVVHNF